MVDVPQRIVCARPLRSLDVLCCQSNACDGAQRCLRVSLNVSFTNDAARLGCFHEGSFSAANDRTENSTALPLIPIYKSVILHEKMLFSSDNCIISQLTQTYLLSGPQYLRPRSHIPI